MNEDTLGRSVALGFWTKHVEAMDTLYDFEESDSESSLPAELAAIRDDPVSGPQLERLTTAAEEDCDRLLDAIVAKLRDFLRGDSRLKIEAKRIVQWTKRIEVRAKHDRSKMKAVLWVSIETGVDAGLMAQCTVGTPGGKSAAERNASLIRDLTGRKPMKGSDDKETSWESGIVLLHRVVFDECLSDDASPSLDMDKLVQALVDGTKQACPVEAFHSILRAGK